MEWYVATFSVSAGRCSGVVSGNGEYTAHPWSGWDWAIEQDAKKPRQWVVLRRRLAANGFHRLGRGYEPAGGMSTRERNRGVNITSPGGRIVSVL